MKLSLAGFFLSIFAQSVLSTAAYAEAENTCSIEACKAGTKAVTYASKQEPYYACHTREKVEYITAVLSFTQLTAAVTGHLPNISDKTGEPEFTGKTKSTIDALRTKAQVSSFDEAIAACTPGKNGRQVIVLNMPEDTIGAVYVGDTKANTAFWMPISALDKVRQ